MTVSDLISSVNVFIGDTSEDRLSNADRYQALTEATSWLLEELGNEHMTDRAEIEYLPTVTWYKMDNLTPHLLTAGQLRFKDDVAWKTDFTRVDARDLAYSLDNKNEYCIERYNNDSYLGIIVERNSQKVSKDLIPLDSSDDYTYTGTNASNITKYESYVGFDMTTTGVTATGIETTTEEIDLTYFQTDGVLIFELEIPDIDDVTSVELRFGDDLTTNYWSGVVTQDVNGDALAEGVNTIKVKWSELTLVGTPDVSAVTAWRWLVNHDAGKVASDGWRLSDMRAAMPIPLYFKYISYRVGNATNGDSITSFTATTDVPFFSERYPQYKFAVAHKAAAILFRGLQLLPNAGTEDREAVRALDRYRKNFNGERDMGSSTFKPFGINLRGRRIIRRS